MPGCIAPVALQQLIKQLPEWVTIVDVRTHEEYAEKHIPGAINIPLSGLESSSDKLSRDKFIVTTCGKGGGRSEQAAEILNQIGFTKARFLCGGTTGWYQISN